MAITLKQLRYLSALAEHRHFGRAAESCAVTQPALSMQIRELERDIGAALVERRPGEVAFTATGLEVVERTERLLTAVSDLVDVARHCGRSLTGIFRLGVIPTVAPYLLPSLLPALQERYPELKLDIRETQTDTLLRELHRGRLDAALIALPAGAADLDAMPLFEDAFYLAMPAADPLAGADAVTVRDVARRKLILLEEGHCLRDQALSFCATTPSDSSAGLGATSLATVMQMVANGYGVTLVPEIALAVEARNPRIKIARFGKPVPSRQLGLAWRRSASRKADFEAFAAVVIDMFKKPEK
jgi:LysR family hydrogen peroxide-inducible transcriptional activator